MPMPEELNNFFMRPYPRTTACISPLILNTQKFPNSKTQLPTYSLQSFKEISYVHLVPVSFNPLATDNARSADRNRWLLLGL